MTPVKQADTNLAPKENRPFQRNKLTLLVLVGLILFLTFFATFFFLNKKSQTQTAQDATAPDVPESSQGVPQNASPFPKVVVSSWIIDKTVKPPSVLPTASIYSLRQNLTNADLAGIASKFFVADYTEEVNQNYIATTTRDGKESVVYIDRQTGGYLYSSDEGVPLTSLQGSSIEKNLVEKYIQTLFSDDTLVVTTSYSTRENTSVRSYELHRDWKKTGLPILNLFGLINIPSATKISSLRVGDARYMPADKNIVASTDGFSQKARPNDFNTVTVEVSSGKILSILSNVRSFIPQQETTQTLISYEEAVNKLKNNQYDQIFTSPTEKETQNYEELYPQNQAQFTNVTVTDVGLAYLENLPVESQAKLSPHYVFRATGTLPSGYSAYIVASVPATKQVVLGASNNRLLAQNITTETTNVSTSGSSLKLGTLEFRAPVCVPSREDLTNLQLDAVGNEYGIYSGKPKSQNPLRVVTSPQGQSYMIGGGGVQGWYMIPKKKSMTPADVKVAIDSFRKIQKSSSAPNKSKNFTQLRPLAKTALLSFDACPVRVSGSSPTLFIYSAQPKVLTVTTKAAITYSTPQILDQSWTVGVFGKSLIVGPSLHPYLYYEYVPVFFEKPDHGWVIKRDGLAQFAQEISEKLGLTDLERQRLIYELEYSANTVTGDRLYIGLIPKNDVDKKLPLEISEKPDKVYRLHFYISPATSVKLISPTLSPIERAPYMLLEIGSVSER